MRNKLTKFSIVIFVLSGLFSCKKLIQISPPVGTVVASNVFTNDNQATSAAAGMYFNMINANFGYANGATTLLAGMSSDELVPFDQNYNDGYEQFFVNNIISNNGFVNYSIWSNAFSTIYSANAILSGLSTSMGVHDSVKNELIGEVEFVRAFCNFYLVNLFGPIPLVQSINYSQTSILPRSDTAAVYQAIVTDLKDAEIRLASDYSVGQGQRIVPNKWAAKALLARAYLYTKDWPDAFGQADSVIKNTSLYSLVSDPNQVFLANSSEAIWQMQQDNQTGPWYNVTPEGQMLLPANGFGPFAFLTTTFLNSFEPGDQRMIKWVDSISYNGSTYYVPYKYKDGANQVVPNGIDSEYYMVMRLAEQYLIRAEAEANGAGNGISNAVNDLNTIRTRAMLPNYSGSVDPGSVVGAILHERQIEFFCEWGNRWFDLKREGIASAVLSADKGQPVSNNALLYPIPVGELTADPKLTQNAGY